MSEKSEKYMAIIGGGAVFAFLIGYSIYALAKKSRIDEAIREGDTAALVRLGSEADNTSTRKKIATALLEVRDEATPILIARLRSDSRESITGTMKLVISMGDEESIPKLIEALNASGTKVMAEAFANSGHEALNDAASAWAQRNGYTIVRRPGSAGTRWGEAQEE